VERTRVLAFLVPVDADDPQATYDRLRNEIQQYSPTLAEKQHVVVLTKQDLQPRDHPLPQVKAPEAAGVQAISSATGQGVEELKEYLWQFVEEAKATEATETVEDL